MKATRFVLIAAMSASMLVSCSDSDDGDTIIVLAAGGFTFTGHGGSATGGNVATVDGGNGGFVSANALGPVFVGVNAAPQAPDLPAAPTAGTVVGNWTGVQTVANGNAIVSGAVTASPTAGAASLVCSEGDIVISGTLTAGDNGATETNLTLSAPGGTVWITGSIRTGRVDATANGDSAGTLTVSALRIIFTGTIHGQGEDNPAGDGGQGADVILDTEGGNATSILLVGGSMDTTGGNASGAGVTGGSGGDLLTYASLSSDGEVQIHGTNITLSGGSGNGTGVVTGGNAGFPDLQGDTGITFNATAVANGGSATSTDGNAFGGNGSTLYFNDLATGAGTLRVFGSYSSSGGNASSGNPAATVVGGGGGTLILDATTMSGWIDMGNGATSLRGGNSTGNGGHGGGANYTSQALGDLTFDGSIDTSDGTGNLDVNGTGAGNISFSTDLGDIYISGAFTLNGGNGSDAVITNGPTPGGTLAATAGNGGATDGGSITFAGSIVANGGSDNGAADGNHGGNGGNVVFDADNRTGSIYLDPGSLIQVNGGNANGTGAPDGGNGGTVTLRTTGGIAASSEGGNISLRGSILALGGSGLAGIAGSVGGRGGIVTANSDDLLAGVGAGDGRGGDITLNAGATIDVTAGAGGDGGNVGPVTLVSFDADGNNTNSAAENGIVQNLGSIVARGSATNGDGGDVTFDGLTVGVVVGPVAGTQDRAASGSGTAGVFTSQ